MRAVILAAIVLALATAPVMAQWNGQQQNRQGGWTGQRIGPFNYSDGTGANQGWHSTTQSIGPLDYTDITGPRGQRRSCVTQHVGQFGYADCQ
jgi:hypothetical protein